MLVHEVAVIGDNDSILGFKAVGIEVHPVASSSEAEALLRRLARESYAVIFVTEDLGAQLLPTIEEFSSRPLPSIILIPSNRGSLGVGMRKLRDTVEKAVGADILSGKEDS